MTDWTLSHSRIAGCDVTESVTDPSVIASLDIESGYVEVDETRAIRRTCSLTCSTGELAPAAAGDLLHPESGHELRPYVVEGGQRTDLGVFRLGSPDSAASAQGTTIAIDGSDRAFEIARRQWVGGVRFDAPGGPLLHDVIRSVLDDRMPGLTFLPDGQDFVCQPITWLGASGQQSSDPWRSMSDLATSFGRELYFDAAGAVVLSPITTEDSHVRWQLVEGERGTLVTAHRTIDAGTAYNAVVAVGEGSSAPPAIGVARLASGQIDIPYVYRSAQLTTDALALSTAASLLLVYKSAAEEVDVTTLPNPRIDVGDVAMVVCDRLRLGSPLAISRVRHDLGTGTAQITLRTRR